MKLRGFLTSDRVSPKILRPLINFNVLCQKKTTKNKNLQMIPQVTLVFVDV